MKEHVTKCLLSGVITVARLFITDSGLCLGKVAGGSPVVVPGDGNCLFYSLSVAMTGELYQANEFRVKTCIEMVVNRETYTKMHKHTGVALVSPDYSKTMKDCVMDWAHSSAWTISAAATVLNYKNRVHLPTSQRFAG